MIQMFKNIIKLMINIHFNIACTATMMGVRPSASFVSRQSLLKLGWAKSLVIGVRLRMVVGGWGWTSEFILSLALPELFDLHFYFFTQPACLPAFNKARNT